jgi:hypothetical protein
LQGTVTAQNGASPAAGTVADDQASALEAVSSTLAVTIDNETLAQHILTAWQLIAPQRLQALHHAS